MVLTTHSVLILVATIIFGVGFGVVMFGNPDGKFLWEALFLGSAFFAAGHVVP
jgi:hypothetical protein